MGSSGTLRLFRSDKISGCHHSGNAHPTYNYSRHEGHISKKGSKHLWSPWFLKDWMIESSLSQCHPRELHFFRVIQTRKFKRLTKIWFVYWGPMGSWPRKKSVPVRVQSEVVILTWFYHSKLDIRITSYQPLPTNVSCPLKKHQKSGRICHCLKSQEIDVRKPSGNDQHSCGNSPCLTGKSRENFNWAIISIAMFSQIPRGQSKKKRTKFICEAPNAWWEPLLGYASLTWAMPPLYASYRNINGSMDYIWFITTDSRCYNPAGHVHYH